MQVQLLQGWAPVLKQVCNDGCLLVSTIPELLVSSKPVLFAHAQSVHSVAEACIIRLLACSSGVAHKAVLSVILAEQHASSAVMGPISKQVNHVWRAQHRCSFAP